MSKFIPLQVPGTSLHVDDAYVDESFQSNEDKKRMVKVTDFARDEYGSAIHPDNGNADEPSYIIENIAHKNKKLIGRHTTIKQSSLDSKYTKVS